VVLVPPSLRAPSFCLTRLSIVPSVSAYAERYGTSETMAKSQDLRRSAAQRIRDLFPRAAGWEELPDHQAGGQKADLVVKFKLGTREQTLVLEMTSLGQPRQIREAMTRLGELRRDLPGACPVAVAQYIGPQGASLLKKGGFGYLDLSGNCHLSFENVLI